MTQAVPAARPTFRSRLARLWRRLRGGELSRRRASGSIAVGLFVGSLPLYGLHLPLCLAICLPLRLDAVTAYIAANISNPLFAPFLLAAEIEAGSLVIDGRFVELDIEHLKHTGITGFATQLAIGSVIVGGLLAAVGALVAWVVVGPREPAAPSALDSALERTIARYASAARGDRFYVAAKLHSDPVLEQLAAQPGDFGRVLDIGCGRGQLGLSLLELGRVSALSGVDTDERKIEAARRAAGSDASFEIGDALGVPIAGADTLLVIDVLHYLPPAEQSALLERVAASLPPGGRVFLRELDAARRVRALPAMLAERLARAIGYNRGPALAFTSAEAITSRLEALGLRCRVDRSGSLSNVLIVAERPVTAA